MSAVTRVDVFAATFMDELLGAAGQQEWMQSALCAQTDPEVFFPEQGGSILTAMRICQSCEVRTECREYSLAHDERFGVWGGLSERGREKLRKGTG